MKLIVFHQLLIASAIVFMLGYGGWEMYDYWFAAPSASPTGELAVLEASGGRGLSGLATGIAMLGGAAVLGVYLHRLHRRYAGQMSGF